MVTRRARSTLASLLLSTAALILDPGWCQRPAGASPQAQAQATGKPLSDEECRAAGDEIARAVNSGDTAALNRLIDWDAIHQRSTAGLDAPETLRTSFIKGLNQSLGTNKGFSSALMDAVKQGGSYTLLHTHTVGKRRRLVFRLLLANMAMNYHDLVLARQPDGKVRVDDIYIFMAGEMLSQTYRQTYLQAVAQASGGLLGRLTGADQKYVQYFEKLGQMNEARRAGKFARVLEIYQASPADLRKEKTALLMRLQAAQQISEAEYKRSIEDFREEYPNDPSINIISVDYFFMNKQYPETIACIDQLDRAVLGDAHLQATLSAVHIEMNDLPAARADAMKAIALEPGLITGYWNLVNVALKEKKDDETLRILRLIRDKFQFEMADLTTIPAYNDFTKSPQYQEWLKDGEGEKAEEKAAGKPRG